MKYYVTIILVFLVVLAVFGKGPPLKAKEVKPLDVRIEMVEKRLDLIEENAIRTRAKVERINQLLEDM